MINTIEFPKYASVRCLMMPYIQGDHTSVPEQYHSYADIINNTYIKRGDLGFLTIDESVVKKGKPQRGHRAKHGRALHTEAGLRYDIYAWGSNYGWGSGHRVTLDRDTKVLLASNIDNTCAVWHTEHEDTSLDGDIGHASDDYPYETAHMLKAGEVCEIGILTPHESLPVDETVQRQFLRIISSGVHGREPHFTENPLCSI